MNWIIKKEFLTEKSKKPNTSELNSSEADISRSNPLEESSNQLISNSSKNDYSNDYTQEEEKESYGNIEHSIKINLYNFKAFNLT